MTTGEPASNASLDELVGGRVRLFQPRRGYRVAIDPVLLAASIPARPDERILDAGCGTFAVGLCLAARVDGCLITGLERGASVADLARASVEENGLGRRLEVVEGDLLALPAPLRQARFAHVATNPPFLPLRAAGKRAAESEKAHAHVEGATLAGWLDACLRRLAPRGHLSLIHRADRLDEIMAVLFGRTGDIRVLPLFARAGDAKATRVIVRARQGARTGCTIAPGLVLHEQSGTFTPAATAILRDGAALTF